MLKQMRNRATTRAYSA